MPAPHECAVRDGDHLLVRMVQRGQQDVAPLDTGEQHAERRRRVQVGRRVEVEVERGAGDHRERELCAGEPEIARFPLDSDRNVGAESPEPARGDAREISARRQPDALNAVGDRPFEHHAFGQDGLTEPNERTHDAPIFVVSVASGHRYLATPRVRATRSRRARARSNSSSSPVHLAYFRLADKWRTSRRSIGSIPQQRFSTGRWELNPRPPNAEVGSGNAPPLTHLTWRAQPIERRSPSTVVTVELRRTGAAPTFRTNRSYLSEVTSRTAVASSR